MLTQEQEIAKANKVAEVLTHINIIAGNYNCKIDDVEINDTITVNVSGPEEYQHDCAVAIGDYVESQDGELF